MGEKTPYENEGNLEKGEALVFFKKKIRLVGSSRCLLKGSYLESSQFV